MAGPFDQLAAGMVADPFEGGRAGRIDQSGRQSRQQMVERWLVRFVAGRCSLLTIERQMPLRSDEVDIFVMG